MYLFRGEWDYVLSVNDTFSFFSSVYISVTNSVTRCNESGKSGGGRDFGTEPPDQRVQKPTGILVMTGRLKISGAHAN